MQGVRSLAPHSDAAVIVDVLSFSTAVDVAVARGASILPYPWKDTSAEAYARSKGALLARARGASGGYSLSPASLEAIQPGETLVLPSPNGSTLSLAAAALAPTYCACLRNARAVAAHLNLVAERIAIIAAGEQWDDGSLRPCIEDLMGAGAVIAGLQDKVIAGSGKQRPCWGRTALCADRNRIFRSSSTCAKPNRP